MAVAPNLYGDIISYVPFLFAPTPEPRLGALPGHAEVGNQQQSILTNRDGAAALVGSLGLVPSVNAGDNFVMGEPYVLSLCMPTHGVIAESD